DQVRNTAALGELGAYSVARRLRSNHDHVQVFTRNDLVVVDSKTVSERQGSALLQVRLDFVAVQLGLELVRSQQDRKSTRLNSSPTRRSSDLDQVRNTAALGELGAYSVARRLRSNHDHVQVFTRNDLVVVDSKTVSERQGSALLQVRLDFVAVQLGLELVRSQ